MTAVASRLDLRRHRWLLALAFLVVLFGVNAMLQPSLLSGEVLASNLTSFLPLILVAIGQTYVVLAGDIDLSSGAIIALVNVCVVTLIESLGGDSSAVLVALFAGVGIGIACGLLNGICVAIFRFQPLVTTFATSIVFSGTALWVLPQAGGVVPESFWRTYSGSIAGVRVTLLIFGIACVLAAVLARSVWYRRLLATGGNLVAAYQSGLPVASLRLSAYAISGLMAAVAALCLVGETASADPLLGPSFTLSSISAVVLGGTALAGGSGGVLGSVLGALILGLVNNVVFFADLPYALQDLVKGIIILGALAGGVLVSRRA
jgi:ribose transport system permease protein